MLLIFICNTSIGRVGNVGFRLQHVIQEASLEAKALIFARKSEELKNFNSNKYEFFSRFLNLLRIFFFKNFDAAYWDNRIFELMAKVFFRRIAIGRLKHSQAQRKIVYVTWYYYNEMLAYKRCGCEIVFDLPIASYSHAMSISALSGGAYPVVENKRLLKLEQDCLNVADQIIVPSFFVKKGLTEHNNLAPDKISVVPFGVDFKKFFSVRKRNMQKTGLKFLFYWSSKFQKRPQYFA